jgi:hypothetical protein
VARQSLGSDATCAVLYHSIPAPKTAAAHCSLQVKIHKEKCMLAKGLLFSFFFPWSSKAFSFPTSLNACTSVFWSIQLLFIFACFSFFFCTIYLSGGSTQIMYTLFLIKEKAVMQDRSITYIWLDASFIIFVLQNKDYIGEL